MAPNGLLREPSNPLPIKKTCNILVVCKAYILILWTFCPLLTDKVKNLSSNEIYNSQHQCKNDLIKGRIICVGFKE